MAITAAEINALSVNIESERSRRIVNEGGTPSCVDIALTPGVAIDDSEYDAMKTYFTSNIPVITTDGYGACPTNYTEVTDYNDGTAVSTSYYTDIDGEANWGKVGVALPTIFTEDIDAGEEITQDRINDYADYLAALEAQCACDCDYCTCNCNYCTCNCNYCTCYCDNNTCEPQTGSTSCSCNAQNTGTACSCNCNNCACNCQYCTCHANCSCHNQGYCSCQCYYTPCK